MERKSNAELRMQRAWKPLRLIGHTMSALVLVILMFFIMGQFFIKSPSFEDKQYFLINDEWIWEHEGGLGEEISLPATLDIKNGIPVTVSRNLPDGLSDNMYLCILTNSSCEVLVGGEQRFFYSNETDPLPGSAVKSRYLLVKLQREDSGKSVKVCFTDPDHNINNGAINEIVCGNYEGLLEYWMTGNLAQVMAAVVLVILSLIVIVTGFVLLIIYRHKMPVIMLAYGTLAAGLWIIFDSFLYQVFTGNFFVDGPMEYFLVALIPYYFIRYINIQQNRRYEKWHTIACCAQIVILIISSTLHLSGIASFQTFLPYSGAFIVVVVASLFGTLVRDLISGHWKEYWEVMLSFLVLLVAGVVQVLLLTSQHDQHGAPLIVSSLYFFLLCGCISMVRGLIAEENEAKKAKRANELKTNFLANMSHEIRTPINAVLGMNEMILRETQEAEVLKYSDEIKAAGESLLILINDILDLSRIEAGRMDLVEGDYLLAGVIRDVTSMMKHPIEKKNLRFSLDVDEGLSAMMFGDHVRIQRVLINLLNNAVKYTDRGEIVLRVRRGELSDTIRMQMEEKQMEPLTEDQKARTQILHIEVEDTGQGIKEEDLPRLFRNFERLELEENHAVEGTGLGLSIVGQMVHMMCGTIDVKSEYKKGSCFIVDIPQRAIDEGVIGATFAEENRTVAVPVSSAEKKEKRKAYKPSFVAPEANVLAVDDNAMNRKVLESLLKQTKVKLTLCASGREALTLCENGKYDLILMDHMMPEMDGVETMHALKEYWTKQGMVHPPVLVLTANAIAGMREGYLAEGFSEYISKPIKPMELEEMMIRFLPEDKVDRILADSI